MNISKKFKTIEEYRREYYKKNKEKLLNNMKEYQREYYKKNKTKILSRMSKYEKEYYKKNKEKLSNNMKEYNKKYYKRPEVKQRIKEYRKKNKEKILRFQREYYRKTHILSNTKKIYKDSKEYYKKNKESFKINHNNYIQRNRKKWNKYISNYINNRLKTNPDFKLRANLRKRLSRALKGKIKADTTMNLVGCSRKYLINYIESQFDDEMSWSAYLESSIHIDHIIPCSSFDLTNEEEQRRCFHYSNLQPLWARDNKSKGNRIVTIS